MTHIMDAVHWVRGFYTEVVINYPGDSGLSIHSGKQREEWMYVPG